MLRPALVLLVTLSAGAALAQSGPEPDVIKALKACSAIKTDGERLACYGVLARWWVANWNSARVVTDLLGLALPGIPGHAERLKTRLFGAAPGHFVH